MRRASSDSGGYGGWSVSGRACSESFFFPFLKTGREGHVCTYKYSLDRAEPLKTREGGVTREADMDDKQWTDVVGVTAQPEVRQKTNKHTIYTMCPYNKTFY